MTGLDVANDTILSISCFITDSQLNLLDDHGWEVVVHHDQATLDHMDEWCTRTHGHSGLTAKAIASTMTPQQAADGLLAYIQRWIPQQHKALLAGNSVHVDKEFLRKPPYDKVIKHLHYRILDVSSVKEAARRWASPELLARVPLKKKLHQSRDDILESLSEAKYYRDVFFQSAG